MPLRSKTDYWLECDGPADIPGDAHCQATLTNPGGDTRLALIEVAMDMGWAGVGRRVFCPRHTTAAQVDAFSYYPV